MAVNDVSGTLGYHGLAGAVALSGVVTAAVWIRGLDPHARLVRYALWLFLVPAASAATAAAFSTGSAVSILTILAGLSTVGAVLVTKALESTAGLLTGVALNAFGTAIMAEGWAGIVAGSVPFGAGDIAFGVMLIAFGVAIIVKRGVLAKTAIIGAEAAFIAFGVALITAWAELVTMGGALLAVEVIASGAAIVVFGVAIMAIRASVVAKRGGWIASQVISVKAVLIAERGDLASWVYPLTSMNALMLPVFGMMFIPEHDALFEVALMAVGFAMAVGSPLIADPFTSGVLGKMAIAIANGMVDITLGATFVAEHNILTRVASSPLFGLAFIALGLAFIAFGLALIGPRSILIRLRQVVDWATKGDPQLRLLAAAPLPVLGRFASCAPGRLAIG